MIKRILLKLMMFSLIVSMYFIPPTNSYLSDNESSTGNTLQATCWGAPDSPTRVNPSSDYSNSADITFSWTATNNHCPSPQTYYRFQFADDSGFTTGLQQSDWITSTSYSLTGLSDDTHYWRILTKDQYEYTATGTTYTLIIDTSAPPEASLSITGSYTKEVDEKLTNGNFSTEDLTGWTKAGNVEVLSSDSIDTPSTVIAPINSTRMVRIGNTEDVGNMVWENRLMQSFPTGAKSLSVHYNFFSREFIGYDEPGFFIRLNGQEIFKQNSLGSDGTSAFNTGWNNFYYDLSNETGSSSNLALYAGNTNDNFGQSWVYIDKVSTFFVSAPAHAIYSLSGDDNTGGSGIDHYEYRIGDGSWTPYSGPFGGLGSDLALNGSHTIQYYSVDKAGNNGPVKTVIVMTDITSPSNISDLTVLSTGTNLATLSWSAPGNDGPTGKASKYDVRYSLSPITLANFDSALQVEKVPSPQDSGNTETLEVLGLNPSTTYYFAIKSADEAPNWSDDIGITSTTTDALTPLTTITAGDIVINELMWMGSDVSTADEWIELRNMTDHDIALSGFKIRKFDGTTYADMITIPTTVPAKIIPAHGYFLVSNYSPGSTNTSLKAGIIDDDHLVVDTAVELSNTNLQIQLTDPYDNSIDTAWKYSENITEGLHDLTNKYYYSMERTGVPGDGSDPKYLTWYTCIDTASHNDFFATGVSSGERGTPGAANRSENEPLAHQLLFVRPIPTITIITIATAETTFTMSDDKETVSFSVKNIFGYIKLSYELSYDAFSSTKGIVGSDIDISSLDTYEKNNLDLATCSGEVCTYDTDVKNVKLIITLTDKDGKKAILEKNL